MDHRLLRHLRPVASRFRRVRLWSTLGAVWLVAAAAGLLLLWFRSWQAPITASWGWGLGLLAALSAAGLAAWILVSFRDHHWVASRIEACFPDLHQRLLTAVTLRPTADGRYDYLQQSVIQETLSHAWKHPWVRTVPRRRIAVAQLFHLAALCLLVMVLVSLVAWKPPVTPFAAAGDVDPSAPFDVQVDPGDTEVEKGTGLIVAARFQGRVPREVWLSGTNEAGEQVRLAMRRSLDDPVFGAHLPEVVEDLSYRVAYDGESTREFRVRVFEFPELVRSDALLSFPEYTQMPDKRIEDTRRVTAAEGSRLTWICRLNKKVKQAELVDEQGKVLPLKPGDEDPLAYETALTLTESNRWQLKLVDEEGRANKHPAELSVRVLPNEPPHLKLDLARDARVSPLEEFPVQATVWDDYGLTSYGLNYSIGGRAPRDIPLGKQTAAKEIDQADYVIEFESLDARPDQLLSYHFWAEDVDSQGRPRRTYSDMFFAEVRHFEEIFREGQPPPGGQQPQQQGQQGQAAQQAEQLAELQKQIINATWRVVRRETGEERGPTFADDVGLLRQSQTQAIEQLRELAEKVSAGGSADLIQPIQSHMEQAVRHLAEALDQQAVQPLQPALQEEQAAYQELLKLRAREHEVQQGQPSGGSGSSSGQSSSRFQQQLQQLELKNDQNRYETQRQAQEAQDAQQREVRQALNRLRELAQRQEDLNERLKELQVALEAAETDQQREELERQLKRLRDQQEQMLRETDELLERMNQSTDPQAMDQARRDLEQNRENVRESAEALERQDVSRALSAGTRAEREFERVRDEFRRQTANQFSEEMRQMREEARQLDERQQELGERLAEVEKEEPAGSLRGSRDRQELGEQFGEQRQQLEDLLEEMQKTVKDAEAVEPLLAQKLYDAFRETRQRRVEEQLEAANELLERGFDQPAAEQEQQARRGISRLRENVEQAAESVLGDETESLRRAVSELDELSRQLNQEIQRGDPRESDQDEGASRAGQQPGDQPPGEQQPGEQQSGEQQARQDQQREPGQRNGQPPGERSDRQPAGQQEGQQPGQQQGAQPGEQQGQQPGQQEAQPAGEQPGQQPGQQLGQQPGQQPGQQQGRQAGGQQAGQPGQRPGGPRQDAPRPDGGGLEQWAGESLGSAPLTGGDFRDWSDRLRDVEEMVGDPRLREEAARIRDRAREIRRDFKRHSKEPQWPLVRKMVAEPLRELRQAVSEELLRRTAERSEVVPIDRDPVPEQFSDQVRRYYERLGSGR